MNIEEKLFYGFDSNNRVGIVPYPGQINYILTAGERSELALIVQIMLNAIRLNYEIPHIAMNGEFDSATSDAVRIFQKHNRIDADGNVNYVTWDRLAEEYNRTVNDNQ